MKIAIIGTGPIGIECALDLLDLGAEVLLFGTGQLGGLAHKFSSDDWRDEMSEGCWQEITSSLGRSSIKESSSLFRSDDDLKKIPSLGEYWDQYLHPLIESQNLKLIRRPFRVDRIQKRTLGPRERIVGKSRILDLFRVVYHKIPDQETLDKTLENSDSAKAFEKLGEDVLSSLKEGIEQFEDFDIVIDCTGPGPYASAFGASGREAINEKKIKLNSSIYYGQESLNNWDNIKKSKKVAIVGTDLMAAKILLKLGKDLSEGILQEIYLITSECDPFGELENIVGPEDLLLKKAINFIKTEEKNWRTHCEETEIEIQKWRDLPDYEKAKVSCPEFPDPQLKILGGYSVTSVDKLIDREGLFLTCETEQWRRADTASLVTIGVDTVISVQGLRSFNPLSEGLQSTMFPKTNGIFGIQEEVGFYSLGKTHPLMYSLKSGIDQIQFIKEDFLNFFSRA